MHAQQQILLLSFSHCLPLKRNMPALLEQHSPYASIARIAYHLKALTPIWQAQHWGTAQRLLDPIKGLLTLCAPVPVHRLL